MKSIAVIILNYKTYDATIHLCDELHRQQNTTVSVSCLVVDNASPNDSYAILKKELSKYDDVTVILSPRNEGYARGNNYGLRYLSSQPPDYVMIANNDIYLDDECFFDKLVAEYEKLPSDKAVTAPKQLDCSGNEYLFSRKIPSFLDDLTDNTILLRKLKSKRPSTAASSADYDETEIVPGSLLFVNYSLFQGLDFFDDSTFLYCEERFLANKTRKRKYRNYIINTLSYRHLHSKSISGSYSQLAQLRMINRERINYTVKHRSLGRIKAFLLFLTFQSFSCEFLLYSFLKNLFCR
jgi:hypothetical protein